MKSDYKSPFHLQQLRLKEKLEGNNFTLILKALLKPLAKNPPNGPMMEAKEESATLWIWKGYRRTVVCGWRQSEHQNSCILYIRQEQSFTFNPLTAFNCSSCSIGLDLSTNPSANSCYTVIQDQTTS